MNINDCPCPQLLKDFLFYMLTIKGRSQRTVDAYYIDLRLFLRYLRASREHLSMAEPNLADISIEDLPPETILSVTLSDAYGFLNFVQTTNENNALPGPGRSPACAPFIITLAARRVCWKSVPSRTWKPPASGNLCRNI